MQGGAVTRRRGGQVAASSNCGVTATRIKQYKQIKHIKHIKERTQKEITC